jgi:hypothetical protein
VLLARLLLEIESGIPLEILHTDCDHRATEEIVDQFIWDRCMKSLDESQRYYLNAVRTCFKFDRKCQIKAASGQSATAATSSIILNMVNDIYRSVGHQGAHSPSSSDHQSSEWPMVSSESSHLTMSNNVPISHYCEPVGNTRSHETIDESHDRMKSLNKRKVRFENVDVVVEGPSLIHAVLNSPVTTTDSRIKAINDTELFAGNHPHKISPNLFVVDCKSNVASVINAV